MNPYGNKIALVGALCGWDCVVELRLLRLLIRPMRIGSLIFDFSTFSLCVYVLRNAESIYFVPLLSNLGFRV